MRLMIVFFIHHPLLKVSALQRQLDAQAQEHQSREEFRDEELRCAQDKIASLVQQVSSLHIHVHVSSSDSVLHAPSPEMMLDITCKSL